MNVHVLLHTPDKLFYHFQITFSSQTNFFLLKTFTSRHYWPKLGFWRCNNYQNLVVTHVPYDTIPQSHTKKVIITYVNPFVDHIHIFFMKNKQMKSPDMFPPKLVLKRTVLNHIYLCATMYK